MCRCLLLCAVACLVSLGEPTLGARPGGSIPSPAQLQQAGLRQAWSTHVELDRSRSRVTDVDLQIVGLDSYEQYEQTAYEIHEIEYDGGIRRIAEYDLDATGRPLGRAEALRLAEKAVIQLEARGRKPQLKTRRVPPVSLYVQSSNGTLHVIDAENGKTLWAVTVGRPQYPTLRPAANDRFVALINGSRLHLLDRTTGETVWHRDLVGSPAFGPAMWRDMVFVPAFDGQIEGYWLPTPEDSKEGQPPWIYNSSGRITGPPTVTSQTLSWATDAGHMYVTDLSELKTRFRLDAAGPILGSTAALPPSTLIVASTDGYIFSVDEVTGAFNWDFSSGEAIRQAPVAVGESVFAVTDHQNLYCLAAQDGAEKWFVPHVRDILTVTQDRLLVSDRLGQIVVLDLQTGGKLASVPAAGLDVRVANAKTDRLYLGTRDGLLVCLETIGSEWPLIHLPLPQAPQETPADSAARATSADPRRNQRARPGPERAAG